MDTFNLKIEVSNEMYYEDMSDYLIEVEVQ